MRVRACYSVAASTGSASHPAPSAAESPAAPAPCLRYARLLRCTTPGRSYVRVISRLLYRRRQGADWRASPRYPARGQDAPDRGRLRRLRDTLRPAPRDTRPRRNQLPARAPAAPLRIRAPSRLSSRAACSEAIVGSDCASYTASRAAPTFHPANRSPPTCRSPSSTPFLRRFPLLSDLCLSARANATADTWPMPLGSLSFPAFAGDALRRQPSARPRFETAVDRMTANSRPLPAHDRWGLAAVLLYTALAALFIGRALPGHLSTVHVGKSSDPSVYMWFFVWWPYAIAHHLNPFVTPLLWAPLGFNVTWTTGVPLAALAAAAVTTRFGPVVAYNLLSILSPALAGWTAFLLCRRITRRYAPALAGGYIFGFSSYMLAESRAHLVLVLVFLVPVAV